MSGNLDAMTNSSQSLQLLTDATNYNIIAIFIGVIVVIGTVLNLFVFTVLVAHRSQVSPCGFIMISLSCCNLLGPIVAYPLAIVANLKKGWKLGPTTCTWYGFIGSLVGFGTIYHLMLLSLERYVSMVYPLVKERIISKTSLTLAIIIAWLVSFILALMPVVGWSSYTEEGIGTSCGPRWASSALPDMSYVFFLFFVGYIFPMIVITLCHLRFLKEISRMADRIQSERSRNIERQMAIVVLLMIIAFNVAWLPYAVTALFAMFAPANTLSPLAASLPAFFAKSSVIYDPVIYAFLNKEFRSMIGRKSRQIADVTDHSIS